MIDQLRTPVRLWLMTSPADTEPAGRTDARPSILDPMRDRIPFPPPGLLDFGWMTLTHATERLRLLQEYGEATQLDWEKAT